MTDPGEEDSKARALGLALLEASRVYEDFVIPSFEGRLRQRRRFPPHRRAIIGLVGRQRRFLRATYTLADSDQVLEAVGPLRSMLEFLVCQRWLALDQTVTGRSGWRTTVPPATCGERGLASTHQRCTMLPWNRSHRSSARKARRLMLRACGSRPNSEIDGPTDPASNSGPARSA